MDLLLAMGAGRYGRIGHTLHHFKTTLAFLALIFIDWQTRYLLFYVRLLNGVSAIVQTPASRGQPRFLEANREITSESPL